MLGFSNFFIDFQGFSFLPKIQSAPPCIRPLPAPTIYRRIAHTPPRTPYQPTVSMYSTLYALAPICLYTAYRLGVVQCSPQDARHTPLYHPPCYPHIYRYPYGRISRACRQIPPRPQLDRPRHAASFLYKYFMFYKFFKFIRHIDFSLN